MPKLYEYFGLVIYFYANEHLPIHVHGEYQGCESKAELIVRQGKVIRIVITNVAGRRPLSGSRLKEFERLVRHKSDDIIRRWVGNHHAEGKMKTAVPKYVDVQRAKYLSGYKVKLYFDDGTARIVDFESFLRSARHPDLAKYRALKKFRSFRVHHGNIMWGDYEMIFPIADLYRGEI